MVLAVNSFWRSRMLERRRLYGRQRRVSHRPILFQRKPLLLSRKPHMGHVRVPVLAFGLSALWKGYDHVQGMVDREVRTPRGKTSRMGARIPEAEGGEQMAITTYQAPELRHLGLLGVLLAK